MGGGEAGTRGPEPAAGLGDETRGSEHFLLEGLVLSPGETQRARGSKPGPRARVAGSDPTVAISTLTECVRSSVPSTQPGGALGAHGAGLRGRASGSN